MLGNKLRLAFLVFQCTPFVWCSSYEFVRSVSSTVHPTSKFVCLMLILWSIIFIYILSTFQTVHATFKVENTTTGRSSPMNCVVDLVARYPSKQEFSRSGFKYDRGTCTLGVFPFAAMKFYKELTPHTNSDLDGIFICLSCDIPGTVTVWRLKLCKCLPPTADNKPSF